MTYEGTREMEKFCGGMCLSMLTEVLVEFRTFRNPSKMPAEFHRAAYLSNVFNCFLDLGMAVLQHMASTICEAFRT